MAENVRYSASYFKVSWKSTCRSRTPSPNIFDLLLIPGEKRKNKTNVDFEPEEVDSSAFGADNVSFLDIVALHATCSAFGADFHFCE